MPRISVDPTKIKTAPKFRTARVKFNWPPHHFLGFLCAFWGMVADNNETGEISDWTPEYLAEVVGIGNVDPNELWGVLVENGYIEQRPDGRVFVQDWLEMMEEALRRKYHNSDPQRLVNIWALYGRPYGREKPKKPEGSLKEHESDPPGSGSFPQGSNQEVTPHDIYKESPQGRGGDASFSPSWETEGKKEAPPGGGLRSKTRIPLEVDGTEPPERRDDKARPVVHLLLERFHERLNDHYDEPVAFAFQIWGNFLKRLLKDFGPQEIECRFENWIKSNDRFVRQNLTNAGVFFQRFNDLRDGPITANQEKGHARRPFDDGAATIPSADPEPSTL